MESINTPEEIANECYESAIEFLEMELNEMPTYQFLADLELPITNRSDFKKGFIAQRLIRDLDDTLPSDLSQKIKLGLRMMVMRKLFTHVGYNNDP